MPAARMHRDQVDTEAMLVRRLLASQFSQWADLPIEPVESQGTDHDIYRLGDRMAVRLPKIGWATAQAEKERMWLPRIAPHLPLAVPTQVAMGRPASGYPYEWSVCHWLPGETADRSNADLNQVAVDLAGFVKALRRIPTDGAPPRPPDTRGGPLSELDDQFQRAVGELGQRVDAHKTLRLWEESLATPAWEDDEVWVHGDLLPGNLLVVDSVLSAVIDFGCLNVGDPACDLLPAWNLFTGESRRRFRTDLAPDSASWLRGRGWALYQAVVALPYYWHTNPTIVRQASHALAEICSDRE